MGKIKEKRGLEGGKKTRRVGKVTAKKQENKNEEK